MSKRALILGINGQDGSYLAELLLSKGYEVDGMHRRSSVDNLTRIASIRDRITLHKGDLCDGSSVDRVIQYVEPHELYNMADQDNVDWSYLTPDYSTDVTYGAVVRMLESVRKLNQNIRVFQPVSATMFGDAPPPQNEQTPLNPLSPYACAKAAAYHACRYYRQVHGMFVSCGIMFNHDSPRRGGEYLLHRLLRQAREFKDQYDMVVHDPSMLVDIGLARRYMEPIWHLMQLTNPSDFCIGTGVGITVRALACQALELCGLKGEWLTVRDAPFRDGPRQELVADIAKARQVLEWQPAHTAEDVLQELFDSNICNPLGDIG